MLPCIMLAIALAVAFQSLEFFPNLSRAGSRGQGWLVLVGLGSFWAIIHVLMSLSRTVRETDRAITTSRGDETRDDVSNS